MDKNDNKSKDAELIMELAMGGVCNNINAQRLNIIRITNADNDNVTVVDFDLEERVISLYFETVSPDIGYLVKKMELEGFKISKPDKTQIKI